MPAGGGFERIDRDALNRGGGGCGVAGDEGALAGDELRVSGGAGGGGSGVGRFAGDFDFALGDEDFDAVLAEAHAERGADGPDGDAAGGDDERTRGVVGDGEVGLTGGEGDAAGGRRERDLDIGAYVEVHHRAIDEGDLLLAGRRGGVVLSSGGAGWERPPSDGG